MFGDPTLKAFNEVASVLSGVKDQNSAQAARPTLVALGQRIRESWERDMATLAKFDAATLDKAMEDARRNPEKAKANAERVRKEQEALNTVMEEVTRQAARVKEVPGGKELLEAFWDASGEGGRLLKGIWESKMNLQQRGKGIDTSSPPTSATPANYAQIRPGMTDYQVLGILGVPLRTDSTKSGIKTFVYAIGNVDVKDGKVVSKVP